MGEGSSEFAKVTSDFEHVYASVCVRLFECRRSCRLSISPNCIGCGPRLRPEFSDILEYIKDKEVSALVFAQEASGRARALCREHSATQSLAAVTRFGARLIWREGTYV